MALNERYNSTIRIPCVCGGMNGACAQCSGRGTVVRRACQRCGGTGRTGGICVDCQGQGWRELDNPTLSD